MPDDETISRALFSRDEPVTADLAIVFSSAGKEENVQRARHGARLFREGMVPRVLVTGGGASVKGVAESLLLYESVLSGGVPRERIIAERESSNTLENALYSRDLLEDLDLLTTIRKALLVSSEWHMRRVLLSTRRFFPPSVALLCCPTPEGCTRENWRRSGDCREMARQEYELLVLFTETGALPEWKEAD